MFTIGFSGKARHGKDTCAEIVRSIAKEEGYLIGSWAFAEPLKASVYGAAAGEFSLDEVWVTKPPKVRAHLQIMGTEQGRNVYGQDYWVLQAEAYIASFSTRFPFLSGLTFTDVRFPNEVEAIRAGGIALNSRLESFIQSHLQSVGFVDYPNLDSDPKDSLVFARMIKEEQQAVQLFQNWKDTQIRNAPGIVLYITSDRPTLTGKAAKHHSEIALDHLDKHDLKNFDGVIDNSMGVTLEGLREQLKPFVIELLNRQDR